MKPSSSSNNTALATFRRYTEAFRALDPRAASEFFQEPALLLTPRGDFVLRVTDDARHAYAKLMGEAREQGYATTVFDHLEEHAIGRGMAAVRGTGAWKAENGEDISRFELSYVLRLIGDSWKIVLATIRSRST